MAELLVRPAVEMLVAQCLGAGRPWTSRGGEFLISGLEDFQLLLIGPVGHRLRVLTVAVGRGQCQHGRLRIVLRTHEEGIEGGVVDGYIGLPVDESDPSCPVEVADVSRIQVCYRPRIRQHLPGADVHTVGPQQPSETDQFRGRSGVRSHPAARLPGPGRWPDRRDP